ncbi:MAG: hypothetical protein FWE38_02080 [Firmicutes bacterium]|nr:hypothetical protein [Bacillota bacterium]
MNLRELPIFELRTIARAMSLPITNDTERAELIATISAHGVSPVPMRKSAYDVFYELPPEEPKDEASACVKTPSSRSSSQLHGYVHMKSDGAAILLAQNMTTLIISPIMASTHKLDNGDWIAATVAHDPTKNRSTVREIREKHPTELFKNQEAVRTNRTVGLMGTKITLGKRVLVLCNRTHDRPADISKAAIPNTHKVALVLDEGEDIAKAIECMDEVFVAPPSTLAVRQIPMCLFALFSAQRAAADGADVLLFIDNLPKMVRLYNKCIAPNGTYDPGAFNDGAVNDVKHFILSARVLASGGSFTPVVYLNTPETPYDQHVYNEFADLANFIIEK